MLIFSALCTSQFCTQRIPGTHFRYRLCWLQFRSTSGRIKPLKNPNDPMGNRTHTLPNCGAVLQQIALNLINCLREKEIPYSSATEISIAECTGSPIASVLRSKPANLNFMSHSFKIHINSIVSSTHPSSKWCLCCRCSV